MNIARLLSSLSWKFTAVVIVVLTLIGGLSSFLIINYQRGQFISNMQKTAWSMNNIIEKSLQTEIVEEHVGDVQRIIDTIRTESDFRKIVVLNKDGEVTFSSDPSEVGDTFAIESRTCQICHRDSPASRSRDIIIISDGGEEILRYVSPIFTSDPSMANLGIIVSDVSMAGVKRQLSSGLARSILYAVCMIVVMVFAIALLVKGMITRRLKRFLEVTNMISTGDLNPRVGFSPDDEIGRLACSFDDMTEKLKQSREELEEKVRERTEQLRKSGIQTLKTKKYCEDIIRALPEGIIAVDKSGKVTFSNQVAETIIGEKLVDINIENQEHNGRYSRIAALLAHKLNGKRSASPVEFSIDGRHFELSSPEIIGSNGNVLGALAVFKDITERKAIEQRMRESDRLASLGELSAMIAHEVENALSRPKVFLELLPQSVKKGRMLEPDAKRAFLDIEGLLLYVRNLKDFSRSSKFEFAWENILEVIEDVVSLLDAKIARSNITVNWDYQTPLPLVRICRDHIRHALVNIMLNSIQSISGEGEIKIHVRSVDARAILEISDSGCGIEQERLEDIFKPFHTNKDNGTGLGLTITEKIIKEHGGTIEVISQVGIGTKAIISLDSRMQEG